MKLEVEIKVSEDGKYGAELVNRSLMIEATTIPSSTGELLAEVLTQALQQAIKIDRKKNGPVLEPEPDIVPAPRSFNADADQPL